MSCKKISGNYYEKIESNFNRFEIEIPDLRRRPVIFFSYQKVELRIAERKAKENKEHMTYLRQVP